MHVVCIVKTKNGHMGVIDAEKFSEIAHNHKDLVVFPCKSKKGDDLYYIRCDAPVIDGTGRYEAELAVRKLFDGPHEGENTLVVRTLSKKLGIDESEYTPV